MEKKKIIEGLISGVLFGFTAGVGFILATRIMTKKVVTQDSSKSVAKSAPVPQPTPMPEELEPSANFSGFNDGVEFSVDDFIETKKPQRKSNPRQNGDWEKGHEMANRMFDFTTGRMM